MLKMSKLLVGAIGAAAAILGSTGALADSKGSVYGDIRYGLDFSDTSGPISDANDTGADTDMRDLNSYVGVKASSGTSDIRVFGVWESYIGTEFSTVLATESNRQMYAGVSTPVGTLSYGRMFTDYAKTGMAIDPFHATSLATATGSYAGSDSIAPGTFGAGFTSYGLSQMWTGELPGITALGMAAQDSQLAYESPNFFGVTLNGAVFFDQADDSPTNGEESHDYGLGASWTGMGINAGVQWLQVNDEVGFGTFLGAGGTAGGGTGDATATRVHAGYSAANFGAAASWERIDLQDPSSVTNDEDYYFVSGWFGIVPGTRIAATWGMTNETIDTFTGGSAEGTGWTLGVFHDVIENFTVHAGGSMFDLHENDASGPVNADDAFIVAVGASYKFDLGFSTR